MRLGSRKIEAKEEVEKPKVRKAIPEHMKGVTFNWEALEINSRKKTGDWYFILWTIGITGAVISIMLDNVLFGILLIVSAFIVSIYAAQKPKVIEFEVSRKGVRADNLLLPFSSLAFFSVVEDSAPIYLMLQPKRVFLPPYTFPVSDEVDIDALREFLALFIEESDMKVPPYQQLMDRVGF